MYYKKKAVNPEAAKHIISAFRRPVCPMVAPLAPLDGGVEVGREVSIIVVSATGSTLVPSGATFPFVAFIALGHDRMPGLIAGPVIFPLDINLSCIGFLGCLDRCRPLT